MLTEVDEILMPARVSLNFLDKCNMSCAFCYVPFDGERTGWEVWKRIVDRCQVWNIKNLTFGGGDPFAHSHFSQLLWYARQLLGESTFIQVDTNGLGLTRKRYESVLGAIDLLGLPLDGYHPSTNALMRKNSAHHSDVLRLLSELPGIGASIKVNTVVTPKNIGEISQLGEFLKDYSIRTWSLYEFWPIGPASEVEANEFRLDPGAYKSLCERILKTSYPFSLEVGSIEERQDTYFFVGQNARAYTVSSLNPNEYVELGSIFDDTILAEWARHVDSIKILKRISTRSMPFRDLYAKTIGRNRLPVEDKSCEVI